MTLILQIHPLISQPALRNYTFLNCSYKDVEWASPITCLSNDHYKVLLEPTSSESSAPCSVISTALVPYYSFDWYDLNVVGVELEWELPDCRSWEARNLRCGLETPTSSQAQGFDHSSKFCKLSFNLRIKLHWIPVLFSLVGFQFQGHTQKIPSSYVQNTLHVRDACLFHHEIGRKFRCVLELQ